MSIEDFMQREYDYVICGGGTAGLVVAARLTENPNITVAVLEAGGNGLDDPLIDAPNLFTRLYGKSQYDWDYKTTPQVSICSFAKCLADVLNRRVQLAASMAGPEVRYLEDVRPSTSICLAWPRARI
jgi:choline dehydrogenase-like flavoprotein